MQLKTGFFSRHALLIVVWSLWFLSAATLLVFQSSEWLGAGNSPPKGAHPEIPGEDPESVLSVIAACNAHVGPKDTLCVAYRDTDPLELFLAYRLAYVLYPRHVVSSNCSGKDLQTAIGEMENQYHPTFLLAFAEPGFGPPQGMRVVARLPLNAVLLQPAASGDQ